MYHEEIEKWTKTELLIHLPTMLVEEQSHHIDSLPRLVMPKAVDTSSVVGGIMRVARDTLPQYAIDVSQKLFDNTSDDWSEFMYSGQITALVGGDRPPVVDALIKRHATVIELWIRQHLYPFPDGDDVTTPYWITEMRFSSSIFSGAMPLEQENMDEAAQYWIAGAEVNLWWKVQEPQPGNIHA